MSATTESPGGAPEGRRVNALVTLELLIGKFRRGLAQASGQVTSREALVLRDLEARGLDAEGLRVMLNGGHVVIDDPALYERWIFPDSDQRLSSHHRDVDKKKYPDYGMVGPLVRESLHGRTPQGTWIQWEHTPTKYKFGQRLHWRDLVHIKDFVVYRLTRKNVGPWGLSGTTEKRPLYLQPSVTVSRPLSQEVAAGFVAALRATRTQDRLRSDPVRDLFAPPPLTRLVVPELEPGARTTGMIGGVPLAVRRVPVAALSSLLAGTLDPPEKSPARQGRHADE